MKTTIAYYSGTDVTKIIAEAIADAWNKAKQREGNSAGDCRLLDITPLSVRENADLLEDSDAVIFGFPVYADFAPRSMNTWFESLTGRGRPCALYCTYGARTSGYAHYHTWMLLRNAGFKVKFSAEFLGRHTFNTAGWKILPDRPDDSDLAVAESFAREAIARISDTASADLHLQRPTGYDAKLDVYNAHVPPVTRGGFQPYRKTDSCSLCRLCERDCPTGAFDADTGQPAPSLCESCQRCLYHCPDQVLGYDKGMYNSHEGFAARWGLTEEVMRHKRSRLVLNAWDTVQ